MAEPLKKTKAEKFGQAQRVSPRCVAHAFGALRGHVEVRFVHLLRPRPKGAAAQHTLLDNYVLSDTKFFFNKL